MVLNIDHRCRCQVRWWVGGGTERDKTGVRRSEEVCPWFSLHVVCAVSSPISLRHRHRSIIDLLLSATAAAAIDVAFRRPFRGTRLSHQPPPPPQPTVTSISLRTGIWLAVRCVLRFGISRLLMSITEHCLHTQGGPGKSRLIIFATIYNTLSVNTLALTLKIEALALSSEALALASCLLSFDLPA